MPLYNTVRHSGQLSDIVHECHSFTIMYRTTVKKVPQCELIFLFMQQFNSTFKAFSAGGQMAWTSKFVNMITGEGADAGF